MADQGKPEDESELDVDAHMSAVDREVARLTQMVERLWRQNKVLQDRVDRLEARRRDD